MPRSRFLSVILSFCTAIVVGGVLFGLAIGQEPAVGSLKGTVCAQETGNRFEANVELTRVTSQEDQPAFHTRSSKDGKFQFARIPEGDYTLEINSKVHSLAPTHVKILAEKTVTINAELAPSDPQLDLYIHQHVFIPGERPKVTARGFVQSDSVDVKVYKVDLDSLITKSDSSLGKLLGLESSYEGTHGAAPIDLGKNSALKVAQSFSVPVRKRDAEGIFTQRIDVEGLDQGFYVTSIQAGRLQQIGWIMVTSMGLVTKTAGKQTLAYAVDLKTGAPLTDVDVKVYVGSKPVASGKTGSDGLLDLTIPTGPNVASNDEGDSEGDGEDGGGIEQTIIARSGESFAFVSATASSLAGTEKLVYAYTDRPVYRPGQTVYYKGIVRDSDAGKYTVPSSRSVVVEVRDPQDTLVYRATKPIDRFGCYSGSIPLNPETMTGDYTVVSNVEGQGRGQGITFSVAAYRKPEFSVKTTFSQKRYVRGDIAEARVSANYYFGAPVADSKVHYVIRRSPYWLFQDDEDQETLGADAGGFDEYGELVDEGDVRTDANGEAVIRFPATWPKPKQDDAWDNDQQFSIEAEVTDQSDKSATGKASVVVTRGEFGISVSCDRYVVDTGKSVSASIKVMDYDKHPIRHQSVTLSLVRQEWKQDNEVTTLVLTERRVTTDDSGSAVVSVPVKQPGSFPIMVKSTDSRGNEITARDWVYSVSDKTEYSYYQDNHLPNLQIVMDKKIYNAGDTAKVLINTKTPGATALVTVEGGKIYDHRTVQLKGNSTVVEIPIKSEYKPNFYIGVCYVRNKEMAREEARARVSLNPQSLRVTIHPSKRRYKPGEKADYTVRVTDSNNRPVSAELSLGVVDEAIYAIAPESTTPIMDYFYAKRPNRVRTDFSFPEIYLSDPDKAGVALPDDPQRKVRVRKHFRDTAFWAPSVITGADGQARLTFDLPDNLTTWRTTVRAITTDTSCGEATNTVIEQQDLLLRLEMPRFLVQKDRSTISAIVHNYTGHGQKVRVDITSPGLDVYGRLSRDIYVADGGSQRIDWDVRARRPGTFRVLAKAVAPTAADAVELFLPVQPHGEQRLNMTTGILGGNENRQVNVQVRTDAIPEVTSLKLRFAPSLASAMLGSAQYLAEYPYGCTEQTTSSFLPDVFLARSLKQLGAHNSRLESELPDMVSKGLSRLYRFQLENGGWSWCEYGNADPWMTAYVCYALVQARDAGFAVNKGVLDKGLESLTELLTHPKLGTYDKAYGYYVLALSGRDVSGTLQEIAKDPKLTSQTLAVVTLGLAHIGRSAQAKEALDRLYSRAISDSVGTHWNLDKYDWKSDYNGWMDEKEITALDLSAALKVNPKDPRVYNIVRWLMDKRRDDYWVSTRETAMVLYAMSDFLKGSKELTPDYDVIVVLQGKTIGHAHFDKSSIFEPQWQIDVPSSALKSGHNLLEIRKTGPGTLYYSTKLTQYLARESMPVTLTIPGLTVRRDYYKPAPRYYQGYGTPYLGSSLTSCGVTDTLMVRLVVSSKVRLQHMLLEDYIPAGCEIVDKGNLPYDEWNYWWVGCDIRDDKVSFYLDEIDPGEHVVEYQMRAGFLGTYCALPAQVFSMYDPGVRATTAETEFSIR